MIKSFRHEGLEAFFRKGGRAGNQAGFWSITVNGNWRVIFRFVNSDVELVDYLDYH
jgi:proteic killer suppression protein